MSKRPTQRDKNLSDALWDHSQAMSGASRNVMVLTDESAEQLIRECLHMIFEIMKWKAGKFEIKFSKGQRG